MNPQPSYSLKQAAELGGQAMLAWLDPQAGYMPITGYEQAHDVGRWWDAILRLEHATGFSIPTHMEDAMLVNLKRLTENPARLLVVDTPGGGEASINPHNLRETMLAYHALVRWRNNDWARQRGHQFLESLDRAIRPEAVRAALFRAREVIGWHHHNPADYVERTVRNAVAYLGRK